MWPCSRTALLTTLEYPMFFEQPHSPSNHSMSFTSTMRGTPSRAACTAAAQPDSLPPTMNKSASTTCSAAGESAPALRQTVSSEKRRRKQCTR